MDYTGTKTIKRPGENEFNAFALSMPRADQNVVAQFIGQSRLMNQATTKIWGLPSVVGADQCGCSNYLFRFPLLLLRLLRRPSLGRAAKQ